MVKKEEKKKKKTKTLRQAIVMQVNLQRCK